MRSKSSGGARMCSDCRSSSRPTALQTGNTRSTGAPTDAKGGHYHHGILKSQPFAVSKAWETADEVLVECRYYSNAGNDAIFRDFPHEFKCKIVYRLTAGGLEQEVMFANRSKEPMPVGVGFHTPMRIPFAGGAIT